MERPDNHDDYVDSVLCAFSAMGRAAVALGESIAHGLSLAVRSNADIAAAIREYEIAEYRARRRAGKGKFVHRARGGRR